VALQAQAVAGMAATSDRVQIHCGEAPAQGAELETMNKHSNVNTQQIIFLFMIRDRYFLASPQEKV
jgi:hypothetical protein